MHCLGLSTFTFCRHYCRDVQLQLTEMIMKIMIMTSTTLIIITIVTTSCRRAAATICPHPGLQVVTRIHDIRHVRIWIGHHYCTSMLACQYSQPKRPGDLDLESGVRVTCDVGYLCANFGLPRPLCSRLRPDVRDRQKDRRQTDVTQKHRLMPPTIRGGA